MRKPTWKCQWRENHIFSGISCLAHGGPWWHSPQLAPTCSLRCFGKYSQTFAFSFRSVLRRVKWALNDPQLSNLTRSQLVEAQIGQTIMGQLFCGLCALCGLFLLNIPSYIIVSRSFPILATFTPEQFCSYLQEQVVEEWNCDKVSFTRFLLIMLVVAESEWPSRGDVRRKLISFSTSPCLAACLGWPPLSSLSPNQFTKYCDLTSRLLGMLQF